MPIGLDQILTTVSRRMDPYDFLRELGCSGPQGGSRPVTPIESIRGESMHRGSHALRWSGMG